MNFSLLSENLEYVWYAYSNTDFNLVAWLRNPETQNLLINSLSHHEGKNFELTLFFLKNVEMWNDPKLARTISERLMARLEENSFENLFFTFYNPLKILILIMEFLRIISDKLVYNKNSLIMTSNKFYNIAKSLITKINDEKELNFILRDKDLEERRVIYIIYENKLWDLIEMQNVENVIEVLWNGGIFSDYGFFSLYSISQNLSFSKDLQSLHTKENLFFFQNHNILDSQHHFPFQRVVWTYNCRIRYFSEIFVNVILLGLSVFGIIRINEFLIIETNDSDEIYDFLLIKNFNYFIFISCIYLLNFPMTILNRIFYLKKMNIKYSLEYEELVDLSIAFISFFETLFFYQIYINRMEINYALSICFSFLLFFVILKFLFLLKNLKAFGPWMKSLVIVCIECAKFIIILALVVIYFGFLGHISLYGAPNKRFDTVNQCILYLVEVCFGQFTFQDYEEFKPLWGRIYLVGYLFIVAIIFWNICTSILTFAFEQASKTGRVRFYHELIGNIRKLEYDKAYGCLVCVPFYLSFINAVFIGFCLFSKNEEKIQKLNRLMCRIGYFPLFCIVIIIIVLLNIACLPIYYFFNLVKITFMVFFKKFNKAEFLRVLFQWSIGGMLIMIWQTIKETKSFASYLWYGQRLKIKEKKIVCNLTYHILAKTLSELYKKGNSICELHQIIDAINQEEMMTPLRNIEKSAMLKKLRKFSKNYLDGHHFKKNNYSEIIKNKKISDPGELLDVLEGLAIIIQQIDELTKEKKRMIMFPVKNILKLMRDYSKASMSLVNFQLLNEVLR